MSISFSSTVPESGLIDPLIILNKVIPYLVDQHLLEKDNAQNKS